MEEPDTIGLVTVRSPGAYSEEESMKRKVMIIGGGASGMTAAIAAGQVGDRAGHIDPAP